MKSIGGLNENLVKRFKLHCIENDLKMNLTLNNLLDSYLNSYVKSLNINKPFEKIEEPEYFEGIEFDDGDDEPF